MSVLEYTAPSSVYAIAWSSSSSSPHSHHHHSHPRSGSSASTRPGSGWTPASPSPLTPSYSSLGRSGSERRDTSSGSSGNDGGASPILEGFPNGARLAIGTFVEEYTNRIQVLGLGADETGQPCLQLLADAAHPYPPTKIGFQPPTLSSHPNEGSSSSSRSYASSKSAKRASWGTGASSSPPPGSGATDAYPDRELLATTADCLRIWECYRPDTRFEGSGAEFVGKQTKPLKFALREKSVLAHSKNTTSPPAPLTSFSWNAPSPNLIVTSSIDTTCTIWDLPTRTALTQLIAHDREVYDVDWCPGSADVFASVGADGSVRVFDLRSLEHSTIIYETGNIAGSSMGDASRPGTSMSTTSSARGTGGNTAAPLLRIAFNPWDANYLATFHLESEAVQILDVRAPGQPILELRGHAASVNAVAWGPPGPGTGPGGVGPSKGMVCSAGDDSQALVYDLASATLRSASAQGRRSRNGAPSPGPGSAMSISSSNASASPAPPGRAGAAEQPILAYNAPGPVNNVAWLRPAANGREGYTPKTIVQEWDEYAAGASAAPQSTDWLAVASGDRVRALRV